MCEGSRGVERGRETCLVELSKQLDAVFQATQQGHCRKRNIPRLSAEARFGPDPTIFSSLPIAFTLHDAILDHSSQ